MGDDHNRITGSGTERARSATGTRVRNKTVMLNSDLTGSVRARLGGEFQPATDSGRVGGLEDRVVTADSNWEVPTVSSEMLIKAAEGAPEEEGEFNEEAAERWAEPVEEDASTVETGEQEQQWEATQPDPEVAVPEDPQQSPEQLLYSPEPEELPQVESQLETTVPQGSQILRSGIIKTVRQSVQPPVQVSLQIDTAEILEAYVTPEPRYVAELPEASEPQQPQYEMEAMPIERSSKPEEIYWKNNTQLVGFLVSFDYEPNGSYLELRVGRLIVSSKFEGSGNCLVLQDESVSPMHAIMRITLGNSVQVLDQLSESGTRIQRAGSGEEQFLSGEKSTLSHGDVIVFGDRSFHLCLVMVDAVE
jgi:FHA domain